MAGRGGVELTRAALPVAEIRDAAARAEVLFDDVTARAVRRPDADPPT